MPLLLAIETSTKVCSVALFKKQECIAIKESDDQEYDHAEKLHVFISEVLQQAAVLPKDLSAILVSEGPGSYTGLRIGVAAAKGFAFALNIPLIAINPLEAMVEMYLNRLPNKTDSAEQILPMLDARRREVFTQSFSMHGEAESKIEAKILEENSAIFSKPVLAIGPGAEKFREEFKAPAQLVSGIYPSARFMGTIGWRRFEKEDFCDLAYFEPFYLKDFIAIKAKPKFNRRNT
ncbi:MAG: tRNA (adenosine(37)-N6)-threonylcarbamoyltransferase complex dimerization subunit type 1 TsaB [Luteibaculum sp.]